MQVVSIHNAKTNLSKYILAAKNGSDIYIGGFGVPEVKLVPVTAINNRDFTSARNKIKEHSDSFTDQTDVLTKKLLLGDQ